MIRCVVNDDDPLFHVCIFVQFVYRQRLNCEGIEYVFSPFKHFIFCVVKILQFVTALSIKLCIVELVSWMMVIADELVDRY